MNKPLVTISIPTYNSAQTLAKTLKAIEVQTYKPIEVNIIDKNSGDKSVKIAQNFGIKNIKTIEGSLLESRYEGARLAKGKYTLILDSDQILNKKAIEKAVKMAEGENYKILVFEENVFKKESILEWLFHLDRQLINNVNNLDPRTGVIMPRFFDTKLLLKAYGKIPKHIFPHTGGPDHAIVYYEANKLSSRIGTVPQAVRHIEPSDLGLFIKKFYRWGYTSVDAHFGPYNTLMSQKERFRTGLFTKGLFVESLGSIALLILKGIPFKIGYYLGLFDKALGLKRKH